MLNPLSQKIDIDQNIFIKCDHGEYDGMYYKTLYHNKYLFKGFLKDIQDYSLEDSLDFDGVFNGIVVFFN